MKSARLNLIYHDMKRRCYDTKRKRYKDYGGRGITVCDEWLDETIVTVNGQSGTKGWFAFKDWSLTHGYRENLTIDRINSDKGYFPNNCRWATYKVQGNNTRRNHLLTYKGRIQTMAQWCEELGLNYRTIRTRLNILHWTVKEAFEGKENAQLRFIEYKGKRQSMINWCRELNLNYQKVSNRLNNCHWSVERAFME